MSSKAPSRNRRKRNNPNELFVGNLSYFCEEQHLYDLFSQAIAANRVNELPRVSAVRIIYSDGQPHRSLMFGFVAFNSLADANEAVQKLDGIMFMGRRLKVQFGNVRGRQTSNGDDFEKHGFQVHVGFKSHFPSHEIIYPTEEFLREVFASLGDLLDVAVKEYSAPQTNTALMPSFQEGYAFATFASEQSALAAIAHYTGIVREGIMIDCSLSHRNAHIHTHPHAKKMDTTFAHSHALLHSSRMSASSAENMLGFAQNNASRFTPQYPTHDHYHQERDTFSSLSHFSSSPPCFHHDLSQAAPHSLSLKHTSSRTMSSPRESLMSVSRGMEIIPPHEERESAFFAKNLTGPALSSTRPVFEERGLSAKMSLPSLPLFPLSAADGSSSQQSIASLMESFPASSRSASEVSPRGLMFDGHASYTPRTHAQTQPLMHVPNAAQTRDSSSSSSMYAPWLFSEQPPAHSSLAAPVADFAPRGFNALPLPGMNRFQYHPQNNEFPSANDKNFPLDTFWRMN